MLHSLRSAHLAPGMDREKAAFSGEWTKHRIELSLAVECLLAATLLGIFAYLTPKFLYMPLNWH